MIAMSRQIVRLLLLLIVVLSLTKGKCKRNYEREAKRIISSPPYLLNRSRYQSIFMSNIKFFQRIYWFPLVFTATLNFCYFSIVWCHQKRNYLNYFIYM